jgi:transposase
MPPTAPAKRRYSTDLTDEQWDLIRSLVVRDRRTGRPTVVNLREVVNALLYLTRTGCQWRLLPTDFPNWNTVRYYFDQCTSPRLRHDSSEAACLPAGGIEVSGLQAQAREMALGQWDGLAPRPQPLPDLIRHRQIPLAFV